MKKNIFVLSLLSLSQFCLSSGLINEKKESTRIIPKKQEETETNPAVDTIITYRGRNFNISGIGCGINTIKDSPIIDNIIIRNDILDANFFNLKIKEKNHILLILVMYYMKVEIALMRLIRKYLQSMVQL